MTRFAISHLPPHVVLANLKQLVVRDRSTTAEMLAHIAIVEERRLYAAEGYDSAFAYCVSALRMSEDIAWKRIRVARATRRHPTILSAIAEGRLHVSGVFLLARWLKRPGGAELLTAAEGKTKAEIEALIAERFPQPDVPTLLMPLVTHAPAPAPVNGACDSATLDLSSSVPGRVDLAVACERVADRADSPAPEPLELAAPRPRLTPLSAQGIAFQCTFRPETVELLRYAQALLGHSIPSGDLADVIDRCVREAVDEIEKRRFAPNARQNFRSRRSSENPRYVPPRVRGAVWARDGGQCTFTSDRGHRCGATSMLQFHHVVSVARGGQPTEEGLSLRCRAHNLYEAECELGAGYMNEKIEASRVRTEAARAAKAAGSEESSRTGAASREQPPTSDVSRESRACVTCESPAPGRVDPSRVERGALRKEPVRAEALRE